MKANKILFIITIAALVVFSVYLIQKRTNDIREQKAAAAGQDLKVATDPNFPEFLGEIVTGFPDDFPIMPGSELVGSALNNPSDSKIAGYRVKWHTPTDRTVEEVVEWYKTELRKTGWTTDDPDTWEGISELILSIERDNLKGYIAAEFEGDEIDVVADLNIQ
jgi:hypothetical protein